MVKCDARFLFLHRYDNHRVTSRSLGERGGVFLLNLPA